VASSLNALHLSLDTDRRGEAAEEEAAGFQNAPRAFQHGFEVRVVAGEVEDGAADDNIGTRAGEGNGFDWLGAEVRGRKRRG
jgi:hypothetical protein